MLRRLSFLAIATTVLALSAVPCASAQTLVYIGGGATFPSGDFEDFANTGWQAIGGLLVPVGPQGLFVGIEIFYGQNTHKEEVSLADDKTSPYGVMAVVDYGFQTGGKITPYVFGGMGALIQRFSTSGFSNSETFLGYEAGVGIEFAASPTVGVFVEGRYMGSKDIRFFAADAGLSFSISGS